VKWHESGVAGFVTRGRCRDRRWPLVDGRPPTPASPSSWRASWRASCPSQLLGAGWSS
jgi:hypothetical protein